MNLNLSLTLLDVKLVYSFLIWSFSPNNEVEWPSQLTAGLPSKSVPLASKGDHSVALNVRMETGNMIN